MNMTKSLLGVVLISFLVMEITVGLLPPAYSQEVAAPTVLRRNLTIDLGDGLMTDAQLTFPAAGDGPFPGVLLVHGSGPIDMDAYIPPEVAPEGKPVRLFLQLAEYLSERGFAVLRYNKRGVGLNDTVIDRNVYLNITFQDLVMDAEKAVQVLREQPEVDAADVTIIGHSEGTLIAPRLAIRDPSIRNIVLMSAAAHSVYDIVHWQVSERNIIYAENLFDTNHDGLLSIQEVVDAAGRGELPLSSFVIQNSNGSYAWYPGLDADGDGFFSIHGEWQPILDQAFAIITTSDPNSPYYDKWLQSQIALEDTNLDLIGGVSSSILILNGYNDIQTPVEEAFLLEQTLTDMDHPDHTLITYPGLGHSFYPAKGLNQPLGAIQEYVLSDLFAWLSDPAREVRYLNSQIETQKITIETLQDQVDKLSSELDIRTDELVTAKTKISALESDVATAEGEIADLENSLAVETQRLQQDLKAAQDANQETQNQLSADREAADLRIGGLESEVRDLQTQGSLLDDAVAGLEDNNADLRAELDRSTTMTYVAIALAVIAMLVPLLYRRR
jgi:pimeloyl-ACP methyl ester carboxylesterase